MKKILIELGIVVLIVAIGIAGYFWFSDDKDIGRGNFANVSTLAGTEANFVSLPPYAVFANSTTTDPASADQQFEDGGSTITQSFITSGYTWAELAFGAIGGTATSTFYARLQLYDGADWSDVHASTTPDVLSTTNTSTPIFLTPTGFQIDPGTASTSLYRYPFYVYGSRQARIIMYGDDLATDPNDGVQIWAKVIRIDPFQR